MRKKGILINMFWPLEVLQLTAITPTKIMMNYLLIQSSFPCDNYHSSSTHFVCIQASESELHFPITFLIWHPIPSNQNRLKINGLIFILFTLFLIYLWTFSINFVPLIYKLITNFFLLFLEDLGLCLRWGPLHNFSSFTLSPFSTVKPSILLFSTFFHYVPLTHRSPL